MKKVLLVALLAIGVSAASYAQGGFNRSPDEQIAQLKTQVPGITDAQSAKLKVIYEARAKSMDSMRNAGQGGGGDRTAMMAMFTKMNDAQTAKIKAVLTADQQAAYQKVVDANAERMKQRMQGN